MKLANQITRHLLSWAQSSNYDIVLPNYIYGRYEMDVFKLSKSLMVTEFEVKTTRADYKRDFQKSSPYTGISKHENIVAGKIGNRFFFVVPVGLIAVEEVPGHAGLIYFHEKGAVKFEIVKHAKILHKNKPSPDIFRRLIQTLAVREQVYREKYNRAKAKNGRP